MSRILGLCLGVVAIAAGAALLGAAAPDKQVARGKYLTEQVAMCIDCHTPRTERGEFDRARWLGGSKLDFAPSHPMPMWADFAPELAGLRAWTNEQVVTLLSTGRRADGTMPRPPMPPYRMSKVDAAAVAAYLRSLKK